MVKETGMKRDNFIKLDREANSGVFQEVGPRGKGRGPVIRQLTLPGGKKVSILREDIYQRALHPDKTKVGA